MVVKERKMGKRLQQRINYRSAIGIGKLVYWYQTTQVGGVNRTIPNTARFQATMIFRQYGNAALTELDGHDTILPSCS